MACQPVKTISSKTGSALLVLDWYRSHSMCPPLHQATLECHHPAYTRRGRYILLFVGPCVLNLFAAVAVAGIARLRGFNWFRSTWRDPAVQAIGASWVVASVAAVFYILLGLLCILASYTSYGVGGVVLHSGAHFLEVFNGSSLCGGWVPNGTLESMRRRGAFDIDNLDPASICSLLDVQTRSCMSGGNYVLSWLRIIRDDYDERVRELKDSDWLGMAKDPLWSRGVDAFASQLVKTELSAIMSAAASAAKDASCCLEIVNEFTQEVKAVEDLLSDTLACHERAISRRDKVLDSADDVFSVYDDLGDILDDVGRCDWFVRSWEMMVRSISNVADAPLILGIVGLLIAAGLCAMYVPTAIAMQVFYGGVGEEPGCPRRCRCLCRSWQPRRTGSETAAEEAVSPSCTARTESKVELSPSVVNHEQVLQKPHESPPLSRLSSQGLCTTKAEASAQLV